MTNGEKMQIMFPNAEIDYTKGKNDIFFDIDGWTYFSKEWWNEEYKESTTNNDLEVDAISRIETIDYLCKHCPDDGECFKDCDEIKHLRQMPSVTPQEPRKGHWKLVQRGKYIDVCCSNCKVVRIKEYAYNYTIDQLNKEDLKECFECADMRYCPNCGSDNSEVEK